MKNKKVCVLFSIFVFLEQHGKVGKSTPFLSTEEEITGFAKSKMAITFTGMDFRADAKKMLFNYCSGTDDVSQKLCLSMFKKKLHL